MGGATPAELDSINDLQVGSLRTLAKSASDPGAFEKNAAKLLGVTLKKVESTDLAGFCNCGQERIERALALTGEQEIKEALGQDPYLSITCDFCRKEYRVSAERIKSLFSSDPSRLQ